MFVLLLAFSISNGYAQEGTKQLMPNSNDRLWLEFNVFGTAGEGFGMYDCAADKRINIRLRAGEKMYFGMKLSGYYSNNITDADYVYFRVMKPDGTTVAFSERNVPESGTGFIGTYEQAISGPNGVKLNGTTITGGYTPFTFTADATGDYYIEFTESHGWRNRFALEFFDVTVTDASNNIITNRGTPNVSAGRLWSKAWQMTTTSFTSYRVNSYFYVFTSDEFINKINFQFYPYSFIFQSNSYGLIKPVSESNYIKRAQSKDDDQTGNAYEYKIYLNDPDRSVWPNTYLAAPVVKVWGDNNLFFDYDYTRTPQQLTFPADTIQMEKNAPTCPHSSVAIFKINSNIDGFTAILIDVDGDGSYSTSGSDRVIYRNMKMGNNYILWNYKTDAGAEVAPGVYKASTTFLGRGPTHFPVYDVEQLDGVQTSAVRPFKKLNASIYWDDTFISRWGDETGGGLMDETQRKNLVVNQNIPRIWSWNEDLVDEKFNGNKNTMNTWFNAIDLGYSRIIIKVTQSQTKCVDGLLPYVGDIHKEGLPNSNITFAQADFTQKFFDPVEESLSQIQVLSLPTNGTLRLSGNPVAKDQYISLANLANLTFTPTSNWVGQASFEYRGQNAESRWSSNTEKVYLTVNTKPTISEIADQNLCTNNTSPDVPFTVTDGTESPAGNLIVTAFSADPTFVPNSSIVLGGSGANRTIRVTPVANRSGNAIIYVMVDDGYSQAIREFAVYVSPDMEFSGDTTLCVGDPLYLVAQETGASSYIWKFGSTTMGSAKILNLPGGEYEGNWSLTIVKGSCTSTRNFEVLISPNTKFTGDANVCVGEELALSAEENNATYEWRKGTTVVSSAKQFYKSSAVLADAADNYSLTVSKDGCTATSPNFSVSVVNQPNIGLTLTGSTVNPGSDGTITVASAQVGVTYNVYKAEAVVASGVGAGANLIITVAANNLAVGANTFEVRADNGNCEIPMTSPVTITVREPGINVSAISGNTSEAGTTATFTVALKTQPMASVTLPISSSDLSEGTVSPTSLTFTTANWNTPQQVTVTGVNDDVIDGDVDYSVLIGASSSSDTYYNGIDPNDLLLSNIDNDVAEVLVSQTTGLETSEVGGTASFTVRLACRPSASVSLTLSSSNVNEGTVLPATLTILPDEWNTGKSATVTGVDDLIDDGDVPYTINTSATSSADGAFNSLTVSDVSVTNIDNDVAAIEVTPTSGLTTYESGVSTSFKIVLKTQPTQPVSISLSSSNTLEGNISPSSIAFDASNWNTAQTITITGVNDDVDDGNITYSIVTSKASSTDGAYGGMEVSDVSVINIDDDQWGFTVTPTIGLSTSEAGNKASFSIKLNSKPTADVSIALSSSNANEGIPSPVSVTFTPDDWKTAQSVEVSGIDDFVDDGDQTYSIITANSVSSDNTYNNKVVDDVQLTNLDNDIAGFTVDPIAGLTTTESGGTAIFTIVLNSEPKAGVTVSLTSSDVGEGTVSPASVSFTTANWAAAQVVTVTGVNDDIADGPASYTIITGLATSDDPLYRINPDDVSVTNNDNDVAGITVTPLVLTTTEGGAPATFSIVLNTQPTADVTISLSSANINQGTVSPASVTFTSSNWGTAQVVTVTPVDDLVDEDDVTYSIVTGNTVSTDSNYGNKTVADVSVTNKDNDTADFIFSQTSGLVTSEAGGTATFTVRLATQPLVNVSFTLSSSNTVEGTVSPTTLTFTSANWNQDQTVTVTGADDQIDDDNVSYTIVTSNATSSDSKYGGRVVPDVSVTNTDNDVAGVTVNPVAGLTTTEVGGTASFNVKLNTKPLANVTIAIASNNTNEGTVSPASFTFTPLNWNSFQSVNIKGVDDDTDDGDIDYMIITGNTVSTDDKYDGAEVADVSVTNTDNDVAGFTFSSTSGLITTEDGGSDSFTLKLNTRPTADVTVNFSSSKITEGVVLPAGVTFNSSNWNTPQMVTVTGVNDDVDDDNVTYSVVTALAVSTDSKYSVINPSDVSVTNTDNDEAGFIITPLSGLETTEASGATTFKVHLRTRPLGDVTLGLSSSNTAEGSVSPTSLTFTSANWNTDLVVTVTGVDDFVDDGNVGYSVVTADAVSASDSKYDELNPSDISVTNIDDDAAGIEVNPISGLYTTEQGGTDKFAVRLTSKPLADVTITLVSSDPTEGLPVPTTLTFKPADWNILQEVTVTGQNDDVDDDDVAYSINKQSVVSGDVSYNGKFLLPSVSLLNTDDDNAGFIFSSTAISYSESDAPATVTVSLRSRPTADVKFSIVSENILKGTVSPAELTFTPDLWNVNQSITVTPVDNSVMDGDVSFNIITGTPLSSDTKYSGINPPDITVNAMDDDVAGIDVSTISQNTREDGITATFTVVLTSQPTADVTINVSSSDLTEGTVSTASLVFTSLNWKTAQTVTVTGVDDVEADGDQTYSIVLGAAVSDDTNYGGIDANDVAVINVDLDQAGLNVFPLAGLETNEAGKTASFTISLNTMPTGDVKINLTSSDATEGAVSSASVTFNGTNWDDKQTVTLTGVDDNDNDGDKTYSVEVDVDASCSDPKYRPLNAIVSAINKDDVAPRPVADNSTTSEDSPVSINVLANDLGLDKGVKSVTIQTQPANGTVVVESDNRITYTPSGLYNGNETFTYRVTDNGNAFADATVTVSVTFANDVPVAVNDSRGTSLNTPVIVDVLFNDSGLEDGGIVVSVSGNPDPAKGTAVRNADNTVTFTPKTGYIGLATFKYMVTDVNGDHSEATVTINVRTVNHNPDAVNDNATTVVNTATIVNVLANDLGLDDGFKNLAIYSQATNGSAVVNLNRTVTYTPNAGFIGTETFSYIVEDVDADYDIATVTVTVTAKPDYLPVANDDRRGCSFNESVSVDVLSNDTGLDDGVKGLLVTTQPVNGTVKVNANNTITYTPNNGYIGQEVFGYQVCDNDDDCASANVIITVKPGINVVPVAVADKDTTYVNVPSTINVLANDSGLDDGFGSIIITVKPQFGKVVVNTNRTVTYTPSNLFMGTDAFKYRVADVDGDYSEAMVDVVVLERPDFKPVANNDSRGCSFNQPVTVDVLSNDTDLDDSPVVVTIKSNPLKGDVLVNPDNTVTYTPEADYVGIQTFEYTVTDADGDADDAVVTINVKAGINIVPVAVADKDTTYVNVPSTINVLANDSGLDDGFDSITISVKPQFGKVVVNSNRTVTYTPSNLFKGTDAFKYRVADVDGDYSEAIVDVVVLERPDFKPVANDDRRGCSFNQPLTVDVLSNDTGLDDSPVVVTIKSNPLKGGVLVNPDNTVTYTPEADYVGIQSFEYTVTDADGDADDAVVTINVKAGINIVPVAVADMATTYVNVSSTINVLANDSGFDDGFGSIIITVKPQFGQVVVNANRTVTYTPFNMFIGEDSFKYRVEDLDGDCAEANVDVVVLDKPDFKPVANDDSRGCSFNQPVTVDVLSNDTDLDDSPVAVTIKTNPLQGAVLLNPDNTVTYTPATDYVGIQTFEYTVTDADGDADDAVVTINVKEGINIVPIAVDDNVSTLFNVSVDINVLANDSGLDDGFKSLSIFKSPSFGEATVNANRTVKYTPGNMFVGTDVFQYLIEDVDGDRAVATVTVSVIDRPNYKPVANDDSRGCSFNSSVVVDVLANDTDLNDTPVVVSISETPAQGAANVNPDGTITYTAAADFVGKVTFRYTVTDTDGDADDAQVTINVKSGENIVPIASDDNATTHRDCAVDINVLANDTGLEDGFGKLSISTQPKYGTVVVNANRTITYQPYYMFVGTDVFEYSVQDDDGDYSIATVTVDVIEKPNSVPVANDDYRGATYNVTRVVDVLTNDTGLDDKPVTVLVLTNPSNGTVSVNADNTINYVPDGAFLGTVEFNYSVTDVNGDSDEATVFINVKEINISPDAIDDEAFTLVNTPVDIHVLDNDLSLYEGIKGMHIHVMPKWGSVKVNANNTITYTPSPWYVGNDEFVYYVEDVDGDYDTAVVSVTVSDIQNSIPVANDDKRATSKNTPVDVEVLINDSGLDDGLIRVFVDETPDPATGSVLVNPDNSITFTPAPDYLGDATFKYHITDRQNDASNVASVTVTVKEVNFIPVASNDTTKIYMNNSTLIDVVANDTQLDDGLDYIRILNNPLHGKAYVFDDRTVKYIPSSWFVGIDSLSYMVADSDGDYDMAWVFVNVETRIDHKPVANPDTRGTTVNQPVIVDVLFNDEGLEDGGIQVFNPAAPLHGSVVVNPDNTLTYTPESDFVGQDVFSYQVCDLDSDCSLASVTINVKEVNNVPIAVNDTVITHKNRAIVVPVLLNDLNLHDGGLIVTINTDPAQGSVVVNPDNSITYTPQAGFSGIDSLRYVVADVDGDYSVAKVVIEVMTRENALPDAQPDVAETFIDTEVVIAVLDNDLNLIDGVKSVELVLMPLNGNCTVESDNTVRYVPMVGFRGDDSFTYRVCDNEGDCDEAEVSIAVIPDASKQMDIPDAFSPNGDKINDTFEIVNLIHFGNVSLKVYNRWGNLVYNNSSYNNDWDGTANVSMAIGSRIPDGTYYYVIKIAETGKILKGSIFIKR